QELVPDVELGADAILGNLGKVDADQARETACSPVQKFVQRGFRAQCHDDLLARIQNLQPLFDPALDAGQRSRQTGGIGSTCLCQVRPSASLASDLGRHVIDQVASLDP